MGKEENIQKLIQICKNSSHHLSSDELSHLLNVNSRTIRNYVREINSGGTYQIIGDPRGYTLRILKKESYPVPAEERKIRLQQVLSGLLTAKQGVSVFDIAEALYISESTVMSDISNGLKEILEQYHLKIVSHDYVLSLEGSEREKRRLIGYIATHQNQDYFTTDETLSQLIPGCNISEIRQALMSYCDKTALTINSYAMNTLILHLIIILTRVSSDNYLQDDLPDPQTLLHGNPQGQQIIQFTDLINQYCMEKAKKALPPNDYNQILILAALYSNQFERTINLNTFSEYLDPQFSSHIVDIILDLCKRYSLPLPTDEFLMPFILHCRNLYQRAFYQVTYVNPLADQLKKEYASIYDMAVYFCHKFSTKLSLSVSDDEIAFIAFHLGSWLENNYHETKRVPFLVVTDDYYQMSKMLIHRIHMSLGDRLHHLGTISPTRYTPEEYPCDFIITTVNGSFQARHVVKVSPILTDQNLQDIENELDCIKKEQLFLQNLGLFEKMFSKDLYTRNLNLSSPKEYLLWIGETCKQKNLCDDAFIEDVILRESFNSTAFTDYIAIPHSISVYAKESFAYIVHNTVPIPWHGKRVNFIMLIGITDGDMEKFRPVLDHIVSVFSSVHIAKRLLSTKDFDEFYRILTEV